MGFLSGLKKVISVPAKAVKKIINTGTDIVTSTAVFVTEVPKKIIMSAGQATKVVGKGIVESAKVIGPEGAIGFAIAGPAGLGAGTFFRSQQKTRADSMQQQLDLAGLGLSGYEIGALQQLTPQAANPFIPMSGFSDFFQPVQAQTLPAISFPTPRSVADDGGGFNPNLLIIGAVLGGGFLLYRAAKK